MSLKITPVDLTKRNEVKKFVTFPFKLYKDCPYWVPPLLSEAYQALNPEQHHFYQDSIADYYLAEQDDRVVGRISVSHNARHVQYLGKRTANFSLFECVNDPQVSNALFEQAFEWAHKHELEEIAGPRGMTSLEGGGVLIRGFDQRAALNIPYNYDYYPALIEAAGFEKESDSLSGYLPGNYQLPERVEAIAEKVMQRRGLRIKSFTSKAELRAWIPRVAEAYQRANNTAPNSIPFTEAEIQAQGNALVTIADPRLMKLVMHGEEVAGFLFSYHDIGPALQKSGGRLFPLGWLYILLEQRRANWVNVNGLGLVPEHQRVGGDAILFNELAKSIRALGFKHADIVNVGETNFASKNDMDALGVQWYKAHRNYRKDL